MPTTHTLVEVHRLQQVPSLNDPHLRASPANFQVPNKVKSEFFASPGTVGMI